MNFVDKNYLKPKHLSTAIIDHRGRVYPCFEKVCYCGNTFYPKLLTGKYCSDSCRSRIQYYQKVTGDKSLIPMPQLPFKQVNTTVLEQGGKITPKNVPVGSMIVIILTSKVNGIYTKQRIIKLTELSHYESMGWDDIDIGSEEWKKSHPLRKDHH